MNTEDPDISAAFARPAEDEADIRAAAAARAEMRETGPDPIPWEEVKAGLGL
jgi:hypothetical protein